jgi:hypothetical protein
VETDTCSFKTQSTRPGGGNSEIFARRENGAQQVDSDARASIRLFRWPPGQPTVGLGVALKSNRTARAGAQDGRFDCRVMVLPGSAECHFCSLSRWPSSFSSTTSMISESVSSQARTSKKLLIIQLSPESFLTYCGLRVHSTPLTGLARRYRATVTQAMIVAFKFRVPGPPGPGPLTLAIRWHTRKLAPLR